MNWKDGLANMEYALGHNPSEEQQERFLAFVLRYVPHSYWRIVADSFHHYKHFNYDLNERCAEDGL